jgi:ech hydrogenase subunit D
MDGTAFLARVEGYRAAGWRLALINATTIMPAEGEEEGAFEIAWGFARGGEMELIRERIAPGDEVPSVSASFGSAFLYENEMRELFGINVTGIGVDLKGQLYKTATRVPFSHRAVRARLEAAAAAGGAGTSAAAATPGKHHS